MKIDSLKVALPQLKDSTRIDCLNTLSLTYSYLDSDTAKVYAEKAYVESVRLDYARGIAMAMNNQSRIAGQGLHDFVMQERISRDVIEKFRNGDQNTLIEAYLNLALALLRQSDFAHSEEACTTVARMSRASGNEKKLGEATAIMGSINLESGNYGMAFEYFTQALQLFERIRDSFNTAIVLVKIGDLYRLAGDHDTALSFYVESLNHPTKPSLQWHPLVDLGDMYYSLEQYDSGFYLRDKYLQVIKSLTIKNNPIALSKIQKAEMFVSSGQFDNAIKLLREDLALSKKRGETNRTMRLLLDMGKAHEGKNDYNNAFYYIRELKILATVHDAKQYIRDAHWHLYLLHEHLNHADSAYHHFRKYTIVKDEVALDEFSKRLAIYKAASESEKKQAQIELLNREKLINQQQLQISEQQLKNESNFRNILILGIIVFALFGLVVVRSIMLKQKNEAHRREIIEKEFNLQRMESENTRRELQQQAAELEMQALRAQMNPHFIFNSLNSINRFILQNNKAQASEYLTKFSKLIRLILQNSQVSLITLESELESLLLYLELEAVRFEHHFEYNVNVDESLDAMALKVPPLIIQPYAENAIWHGLMHKEDKGKLVIELFQQEELLCCRITDDGIGRKRATELKSKSAASHKSLGMRITAERISLLEAQSNRETSITVRDLVLADGSAGGTEVFMKLPLQYD